MPRDEWAQARAKDAARRASGPAAGEGMGERWLSQQAAGQQPGKSRKKRRRGRRMKGSVSEAIASIQELRDLASDHSLTVSFSMVRCGRKKQTAHFMFNDANGHRVLNYWPGNGTTTSPVTLSKGTAADCWAALDEAARIDAERRVGAAPKPREGSS